MVLIFAQAVQQVVKSVGHPVSPLSVCLLSVCLSVPRPHCPNCPSVSRKNQAINQLICCSRAQLGPARTWIAPSPSRSGCTPWVHFTATVILLSPTRLPACTCPLGTVLRGSLPNWRTYLGIDCAFPVTFFSLFSCSNSIFFFPPSLSPARPSCPLLHLSSHLLPWLNGPGRVH